MSVAMKTVDTPTSLQQLLGRSDVPLLDVSGIALDSRRVQAGDVFFACKGRSGHGLRYAQQAINLGCAAIVFDPDGVDAPAELSVPTIAEPGLAEHLGIVADRFFGYPSKSVDVIGITGTNGKTTVAWMLADCLRRLGKRCAYSGTLGFGLESVSVSDGMTTPDVFEMHRRVAEARDAGAIAVAQEVSSHALDQGRVDEVRFRIAAFTNLSRDHLDYHDSMLAYEAAKQRLFTVHAPRIAVINVDSDAGRRLAELCAAPVVTVSTLPDASASVVVKTLAARASGFEIAFDSVYGSGQFELPLLGTFNVENAVVVLGILLAYGATAADAANVLGTIAPPPGRLQTIGKTEPAVVIDYAHTPDALESALKAVRPNTRGELWCVFGCGGDRDKGKRPMMASVAERFADRVIVTSDNPRSEAPAAIMNEIAAGFSTPVELIEDRLAAINRAVSHASRDDLILIAGKGHEQVQHVGTERLPFSDLAAASQAFAARGEHA